MTLRPATRVTLAAALLGFVACDGEGGVDAGAPEVDAGPRAEVECDLAPAPVVAGTAETDALADAPGRCGQPAHTWLRDPSLGALVEAGPPTRYGRRVLQGLLDGEGVILPRPVESGVELRTIRYTTQDRGVLVESTAVVGYPDDRDPGEPLDALLFAHGTSGFTQGCGPTGSLSGQLLVGVFASFGYLVVAPDYLGLESGAEAYAELHPYLVGQATAIASLDALRAAIRLAPEDRADTCSTTRYVSVGGSQGGHAVLWNDRLAPYYARELEHLGVVATVPPADLFGQIERGLTQFVDASANTAALYGTTPYWYGVGDRLDEVLASPYDATLPATLDAECSPSDFDDITQLDEVFAQPLLDAASGGTLADFDVWGCILTENGLTTTSVPRVQTDDPAYGILFVTGSEDPLVNTPIERVAFEALCDAGMPLEYLECEGADHGDTTVWALPEIIEFAEARFRGEAFARPGSCAPPPAVRCAGTP